MGLSGSPREHSDTGGDPAPRARTSDEAEQARRLYVRELLLGETSRAAYIRILRKRRESNGLGDHQQAHDPRVLRQTYRERTPSMVRSQARRAWTAHAST